MWKIGWIFFKQNQNFINVSGKHFIWIYLYFFKEHKSYIFCILVVFNNPFVKNKNQNIQKFLLKLSTVWRHIPFSSSAWRCIFQFWLNHSIYLRFFHIVLSTCNCWKKNAFIKSTDPLHLKQNKIQIFM